MPDDAYEVIAFALVGTASTVPLDQSGAGDFTYTSGVQHEQASMFIVPEPAALASGAAALGALACIGAARRMRFASTRGRATS